MISDLLLFILSILFLVLCFFTDLRAFATALLGFIPLMTYSCYFFYREYRLRRGWQQYCKEHYNIDIDLFYNIKTKKKKKGGVSDADN